MKTITIWTIELLSDSDVYSIRAKTKADAIAQLNREDDYSTYSKWLEQREYQGSDLFDLVDSLLREGRGCFDIVSRYDLTKLKSVDTRAILRDY